MHRACLIVPRAPGAIRVALGRCGRVVYGVGEGVLGLSYKHVGISWDIWVQTQWAIGETDDGGGRSGGGLARGRGGGGG